MNAHFTFETEAFGDSAEVRAGNVNGIVGHSLARWLGAALREAGLDASEPWPEDHGWDFGVNHDGARYLCSCSITDDPSGPNEAHVTLTKIKSFMGLFNGRNAFAGNDAVAAAIHTVLQSASDVRALSRHV